MSNVVLGITGSIAAYKAAELVRLMKKREWDVSVIMTEAATKFIGPLTLRTLSNNPVGIEMFPEAEPEQVPHIALSDWADCIVVAPCTANVIAKAAQGISDDLLSCTLLACTAPIIIAPAMNVKMWDHPATQANVAILKERGVNVLDVGEGDLACGYQGRGRLVALDVIMEAVESVL
ncbi:MAG: flavoprotein [Kiritimatiellia bacterium]|jgi:phosphopantothenoylcysteine decarboxylase/phosphopantothenate--cysteine ligase|nr:flavoprotein [Kiritimatiellia bacterium]MDP6629642.1 flavoprotein [Kiritimatiellia bacterium]MDP6811086.1 flavoprotein [Kiritimatiellia bacterium]MDP7024453.1 flavoprotein [Kiritimatiellia bacterium]